MKVYSLTSLIISFFIIFSGLFTPHIFFHLSISEFARIYYCNLVNWFYILFFIYGNCLDILMNLERTLSFSNKYQKIKKISAYFICFIAFILCVIIHIPSNLISNYTPNNQVYITFKLCSSTSFASSPLTRIILILSYIIEGPVLIILAIGSNVLAYNSYRSFILKKEQLRITTTTTTNNDGSIELTENEKRMIEKNEKMNKKMLLMTICLTIFSIISHLIQFATQLIAFVFSVYFS